MQLALTPKLGLASRLLLLRLPSLEDDDSRALFSDDSLESRRLRLRRSGGERDLDLVLSRFPLPR